MSEKTIENYGKSFLVLILPISFVIVLLVNTWKVLLVILLLLMVLTIWQQYTWEKWCNQVNPLFYELIRENQGKITPMDLAIKANFSGETGKRYLDAKAKDFGASVLESENEGQSYYFITASILGDILDSSESSEDIPRQPVTKVARSFLAQPTSVPQEEKSEYLPEPRLKQIKKPLQKQLVFVSLIQSELAKRLNVYSSTIYKRRNDPDFPEWSRSRDPDGIAWSYSRRSKDFFPIQSQKE
ncbi:MAG: hypothetical protein ACK45Z_14000 [Dolichospermum sp.]